MENRPFRFGISFGGAQQRNELIAQLRAAEEAGFDVVCTADHLSERHAAFPFLASIAQMTSMRVSPMVIANDYRHPAVTARDSASIDILSEGRFELGIGTGWIKDQYDAAGLRYDAPGVRVERLEESISVIKDLWTGDPVTFEGEHYQINGLRSPVPLQVPRPPILIAGSGRRMMRLAGREADIVGISPLGPSLAHFSDFGSSMSESGSRISAQIEWIRQGAGERFEDLELSVTINHVEMTDDSAKVVERLASEWEGETHDIAQSLHVLVGSEDELVDRLAARRAEHGLSYVIFSSLILNDVAGVVRKLAGT